MPDIDNPPDLAGGIVGVGLGAKGAETAFLLILGDALEAWAIQDGDALAADLD